MINRYYFDYNATAPLADSVKEFLARGAVFFNSSSSHTSGKVAKKEIFDTTEFIQKLFKTKKHVIYHSGATEGINLFFHGRVKKLLREKKKVHLIGFATDHSAVLNTIEQLRDESVSVTVLPVLTKGEVDLEALKKDLQSHSHASILINVTWVNNESGIVQNLKDIVEVTKGKSVSIHVDGVQAIGKIPHWNELLPEIEAYTFSGHKFGSLTGVGITLLHDPSEYLPLIIGGGQQNGLRGGTENVLGVVSLRLALENMAQNLPLVSHAAKDLIENKLKETLGDQIIIVGLGAVRNVNTIQVIYKKTPSDSALIHFDLAGMDVSAGSACSSGRMKASHVLVALGYHEWKNHGLRFSFSPQMSLEDAQNFSTKIISVFQKI